MKKISEKSKSASENRKDIKLPTKLKKWDVISKVILGLLGIFITFVIQYQQFRLAKTVEESNREFEKSRIMISQGQLAGTLIENIITGNEKEKQLALAILEMTSKEMFPRIMDAMAIGAPDESTRIKAIQSLGLKGDRESVKVLKEIAGSEAPEVEKNAAVKAREQLKLRFLNTARAYYETGLYQSAAYEFEKVINLIMDSNVDQSELELARTAYSQKDYQLAATHYKKATDKISQ